MTKIIIHTEEFEALSEKEFFILKAKASEKIRLILQELNDQLIQHSSSDTLAVIRKYYLRQGKISRGENYLGLPYMVLDYPGYFKPESVLTFRCKFWWGSYFSFYWILSGELFKEVFTKSELEKLKGKGYLISVSENLWDHRFESPYAIPLDEYLTLANDETNLHFLKLGKKIDLDQWETLPEQAFGAYSEILSEVLLPLFKNR